MVQEGEGGTQVLITPSLLQEYKRACMFTDLRSHVCVGTIEFVGGCLVNFILRQCC